MNIALATCLDIPEPDFDEPFMLEALRAAGHEPVLAAWDDPTADWSEFDACIVRSTWDYYLDPDAFGDWIREVDRLTTLANPAGVLLDNIDKRYLARLEASGIPVIPTAWVDQGASASLAGLVDEHGWGDVGVVIKPTLSAGSWKTRRFAPSDLESGQAFLQRLSSERDVMVQRFMPSVVSRDEGGGERCLVRLGDTFTHAIEKKPRFDGEDESVSDGLPVTETERALAEHILEAALGDQKNTLTYARVDLITDDTGAPMLSELELLEPSLFLKQAPGSRAAFAEAAGRLGVR